MSTNNSPDEKRDSSNWYHESFDREEMADLMDREPDCWQGAEPKDEKRNKSCGARATIRNAIGDLFEGRPDG